MRIFRDCREMYNEVRRDLHEMGTIVHPQTMQDKIVGHDADYRTLELSPATFTIIDGQSDADAWLNDLGLNLRWAQEEFSERMTSLLGNAPVNPGHAYLHRGDTWNEFIHDGKFSYTYSERFALNNAIARVITELRHRPDTRQAVLPIFNNDRDLRNVGGIKRIPCSLHYQFTVREEKLKLFYVMRSTDFNTHFPYDIWLALRLQEFVANELDLAVGYFTFFTGSLHLYAKDADPGVF